MHAVIHMGLHKTGTTFIQHLANRNHESLLKGGIYYHPMVDYPAHNPAAWQLLRGNPDAFVAMAERAREKGAGVLLVSSEDLESLIFRPELAALLVTALETVGVRTATFVIYIRRQDKLFWSLYSELSQHIYVDPFQMLNDVLRLGYAFLDEPEPGLVAPPFWYFCFDHRRHVTAFARRISELSPLPVTFRLFSFDDFRDFLGDELFDALGARDMLSAFPSPDERNTSLSPETVCRLYAERFQHTLREAGSTSGLHLLAESRMNISSLARVAMSEALMSKFGRDNDFIHRPLV